MTLMYTPVFTEFPDDPSERWKRIRQFANHIYETDIPWSDRVPPSVKRLESAVGQKLPRSVVEWMMFGRDFIQHCPRGASDFAHLNLKVRQSPELKAITLTEVYEDCRRWAVRAADLGQDDPLVGSFAYVRGKEAFVFRRTHGLLPVTDFAVQLLALAGAGAFSRQAGPLDDPSRFLASLPKSVSISPPIGGIRLVESTGWYAMVLDGMCLEGGGQQVILHYQSRGQLKDYPKPLRDAVHLTPKSLRPRPKWREELLDS